MSLNSLLKSFFEFNSNSNQESITINDEMVDEFKKLVSIEKVLEIPNNKLDDNNLLSLVLFNLGFGPKLDLNEAKKWNQRINNFNGAILRLFISTKKSYDQYRDFISEYNTLMEVFAKIEINDDELLVRFLYLLSKWLYHYGEYELSDDFDLIYYLQVNSNQKNVDQKDLQLDQLINKYQTQKRQLELKFLSKIFPNNQKLDFLMNNTI